MCLGAFVYKVLDCRGQDEEQVELPTEAAAPQPTVIPGLDSITGDLLDLDLSAPAVPYQQAPVAAAPPAAAGGVDLLGDGLDNLVSRNFLEFEIKYHFLKSRVSRFSSELELQLAPPTQACSRESQVSVISSA